MALFSYSAKLCCILLNGTFQLFYPNCIGYFLMALFSYSVQTVLDAS